MESDESSSKTRNETLSKRSSEISEDNPATAASETEKFLWIIAIA